MADLEYYHDGIFTKFISNTDAGHSAWNQMANELGGCATILTIHLESTLRQLRKAGYTVSVLRRDNKVSLDEIFKELEEWEA